MYDVNWDDITLEYIESGGGFKQISFVPLDTYNAKVLCFKHRFELNEPTEVLKEQYLA